jgi:hypothetical protein
MDSFPVGDVFVGMRERHCLSSWFGSLRVKFTITKMNTIMLLSLFCVVGPSAKIPMG